MTSRWLAPPVLARAQTIHATQTPAWSVAHDASGPVAYALLVGLLLRVATWREHGTVHARARLHDESAADGGAAIAEAASPSSPSSLSASAGGAHGGGPRRGSLGERLLPPATVGDPMATPPAVIGTTAVKEEAMDPDATFCEAVRSVSFWCLFLAMALGCGSGLVIIINLDQIHASRGGSGVPASLEALLSICNCAVPPRRLNTAATRQSPPCQPPTLLDRLSSARSPPGSPRPLGSHDRSHAHSHRCAHRGSRRCAHRDSRGTELMRPPAGDGSRVHRVG